MPNVKISDFSNQWSGSSTEFNGIKLNIIDIASSGSSKAIDLQVNSSSVFNVRKDSVVTATTFVGNLEGTSSYSNNSTSSSYALTSSYAFSYSGTSGTSGAAGSSGTSGTSGAAGSSGKSGTSGAAGSSGTSGTSGAAGSSGTSGTSGAGGSLETGSLYSITSSWSISSSFSENISPYAYVSDFIGVNWTNTNLVQRWRDVAISEDGRKMYAANFSGSKSIWNSNDYGNTWYTASFTPPCTSIACSSDGNRVYSLGYYQINPTYSDPPDTDFKNYYVYLVTSSNAGTTWTAIEFPYPSNVFGFKSLECSSDGSKLYAFGYYTPYFDDTGSLIYTKPTSFYKSTNYGVSWNSSSNYSIGDWNNPRSIKCSSDGQKLYVIDYFQTSSIIDEYTTNYTTSWNET